MESEPEKKLEEITALIADLFIEQVLWERQQAKGRKVDIEHQAVEGTKGGKSRPP